MAGLLETVEALVEVEYPVLLSRFLGAFCCSYRFLLSRTGFPTRLKGNRVGIGKRKTSRVIVREKLSKRAVVKEDGSDGCIFMRGD